MLNAYSQVFVVSMAEVVVCWSVAATMVALGIKASKWVAIPVAAAVASLLFGAYHFAHSPPFNTVGMVSFLSVIGLLTSAVFFVSRDVYATILFHNFLGMFGVVQALAAQDKLAVFQTVQAPLVGTALVALSQAVLARLETMNNSKISRQMTQTLALRGPNRSSAEMAANFRFGRFPDGPGTSAFNVRRS